MDYQNPGANQRPPVGYGNQPGAMPPQGYPQPGMPPQGYPQPPQQGMPVQGYPQGMPVQGYPQGAVPPQGAPANYGQPYGDPYGAPPQGDLYGQTPPMAYHPDGDFAQPTGFVQPQRPVQPPKQKSKALQALQAIAVAAVVFAAVWYLYGILVPKAEPYATVQAGVLGARYSGDCIIVRDEVPYDAEGVTSVDYTAEEGSAVSRNDEICNVYSSSFSTREMNTLLDYREDIREYQKELLDTETTTDTKMARLQSDVLTRAKEVRDMIGGARGSMTNQEQLLDRAIYDRQQYFKQKYSDDQRLSRLYDDERSQMQRIDSWTKSYTATSEGLVSFYSDGYEYGLTSTNYASFNPAEVRAFYNGKKPEKSTIDKGKTTIFRLVKDNHWNVLFLAQDTDWNPIEGQTYELQLERFENTQVNATVESFTRSGGELLVRLRVYSSVLPVMYMRTCQAELGESVSTLMVPQKAIYHQDDMSGVVMVDGANESFIPVNIIWEQDGYAYINAVQQGLIFEGMQVKLF